MLDSRGPRNAIRNLVARYATGAALNFTGSVFLARALGPNDWGIFGITYVAVVIAQQTVERGSAGFLIQRRRAFDNDELGTCLLVQLVLGVVTGALLAASGIPIADSFGDPRLILLFQAAGLGSLFYALRAVPMGVLEREFNYGKVAAVEIIDVMLFTAVAVGGVALGFGLAALAVATVTRAAISLIWALIFSGVTVSLKLRANVIGDFARFGLPYAGSNVLNFANNAAAPVLVGTYAGVSEFGILQLAYTLLFYPQTLTVIIGRIGFATYARVEGNEIAESLSRSTGELLRIAGGLTVLLAASSVFWIPLLYGDAWVTASRYLLVVGPAFALATSLGLVTAALNAVGRAGAVFILSLIFCVAYWATAYVLVPRVGGLGLPIAYSLATATYCGYLAVARTSFGNLRVGRVLLEYFVMCSAALGFVTLYVSGAPWPLLGALLALMAAWPVSQLDLKEIYSMLRRSRPDRARVAKS